MGGALDEALDGALAAARAAWPAIMGDAAAFRQSLLRGVEGNADQAHAIAALFAADLWLAQACAAGTAAAIAAFDREHVDRVPLLLSRHPARPLADEVRQQMRERLLVARDGAAPRIADYTGRGPLSAWFRVATLRTASNLMRSGARTESLGDRDLGALADAPELRVLEGRYRGEFRAAFRRAFAALDVEQRAILKLHFVDGVTVRRLAPILGTSPATAGRRLLAAQERLGEVVIAELAAATDQPAGDLESVVRTLMSRLEVSLSALVS